MLPEIKPIRLLFPYHLGDTNCYLIKTDLGYILIDTGFPSKRADLEQGLTSAGCQPGSLQLILLTHGDPDHTGNCVYLREKYSTQDHPVKIAMHRYDSGVVENGDNTLSRKKPPFLQRLIGEIILQLLSAFMNLGTFERFKPDFYVEEGDELSDYGFDAKILRLPGHSRGSIGILTNGGDASTDSGRVLFCGDLLWNMRKPEPHGIVDDAAELNTSLARLKSLDIKTVYPGHGAPFLMKQLINNHA